MSTWERQYQNAVAHMISPDSLDQRILQQARQFKPPRKDNRWLSKAASGCAAVAVVVLLIHPAQYLGALTPNLRPAGDAQGESLNKWRRQVQTTTPAIDSWFELRSEVKAGNYVNLCNQWRRQQRSGDAEKLPRDLESRARDHCRLLPTP